MKRGLVRRILRRVRCGFVLSGMIVAVGRSVLFAMAGIVAPCLRLGWDFSRCIARSLRVVQRGQIRIL